MIGLTCASYGAPGQAFFAIAHVIVMLTGLPVYVAVQRQIPLRNGGERGWCMHFFVRTVSLCVLVSGI